ncbi:MAG: SDR family NAD(P)-dependent oxidoreductase [Acidimicrobiales bacterium]
MDDFSGARAVITGGASGIGDLGLATALLEQGRGGRRPRRCGLGALDAAVDRLRAAGRRQVIGLTCDVTDPASVEAMAEAAWQELGSVEWCASTPACSPVGRCGRPPRPTGTGCSGSTCLA